MILSLPVASANTTETQDGYSCKRIEVPRTIEHHSILQQSGWLQEWLLSFVAMIFCRSNKVPGWVRPNHQCFTHLSHACGNVADISPMVLG